VPALPAATVAALHRHPVKGLSPEPLNACRLETGGAFPGDRLFAVEIGPSGFDPQAPGHISKMRFAVLARTPEVARVESRWDEAARTLAVSAPGHPDLRAQLDEEEGKAALADWLTAFFGEEATGPLRVLDGAGHRFMDDPAGRVSLLNLASVRDLGEKVGRPLDPARFRANIHVEGWPAWAETQLVGRTLRLGGVQLSVTKPIARCVAIDVDPRTAKRDGDLVRDLVYLYGHTLCGLYLSIERGGALAVGDAVDCL
jgi:uncharacterized protein